MLSKCANPDCQERLRYLRGGRIFVLSNETLSAGIGPNPHTESHPVQYYWLCQECCRKMTLAYESGKGITVQPLTEPRSRNSELRPLPSDNIRRMTG